VAVVSPCRAAVDVVVHVDAQDRPTRTEDDHAAGAGGAEGYQASIS